MLQQEAALKCVSGQRLPMRHEPVLHIERSEQSLCDASRQKRLGFAASRAIPDRYSAAAKSCESDE